MEDISFIINLMKERTGVIYSHEKSYVITTKLYPLVIKHKFKDAGDLINEVKRNVNKALVNEVIDSLLINETFFFRDKYPYEALERNILPDMFKNEPNKKMVRVLCAACSTGQEPYSLAMYFIGQKNYNFNYQVVGIDISNTALEKARSGAYNKFEIQRGLTPKLIEKFFTNNEDSWIINNDVKQHVSFYQYNILQNLSALGKFDIIFCRNVLIYFDGPSRNKIINNLLAVMNPSSTLILGGTENLALINNPLLKKITIFNGIYTNST